MVTVTGAGVVVKDGAFRSAHSHSPADSIQHVWLFEMDVLWGWGVDAVFLERCSVVNTEQAGDRGIGLTEDENRLLFGGVFSIESRTRKLM